MNQWKKMWLELISIVLVNRFHYLLPCFLPASSLLSHKLWFISIFVCHKLNYTLLWWLWAACTRRFIKYPSPLLTQACLIFKAPGVSSLVLQSVYFPTCSPTTCSHARFDAHGWQHTLMALWWDAWPWRQADIEEGPRVSACSEFSV